MAEESSSDRKMTDEEANRLKAKPLKNPCSKCDCDDFIQFGGRVNCQRPDCNHSVFDHT